MELIYGKDYDRGWAGFTFAGGAISDGISYGERWERSGSKFPPVSHAFICTGENAGIEAHLETGVDHFDLRKYSQDSKCKLYFRKPRFWTPELGARIVATALMNPPFGLPYDKNLIVADALVDTFAGHYLNLWTRGWFKKKLCKTLGSDKAFICSETVAYVLRRQAELQGRGCLADEPDTVDPQFLFEDDFVFDPGFLPPISSPPLLPHP